MNAKSIYFPSQILLLNFTVITTILAGNISPVKSIEIPLNSAKSSLSKLPVDQLQLSISPSAPTPSLLIELTEPLPSADLEASALPPIAHQIAQVILPPDPIPQPPLPSQPLPPLPPPEELLPTPVIQSSPSEPPIEVPQTLFVQRFEVVGSRVFTPEEFAEVTAPFSGREISFAELLQARSAVTQLYVNRGYVTSGAFIPPQTLEGGVVKIEVIEGSLEDINITGTRRLQPSYIRSRIRLAASTPLNVPRLLEGLQLLQLDPLIETISADLQAGTRPGTSLLQIQVSEADTFSVTPSINNGGVPSVGSFRRQLEVRQANLIGLGDDLQLGYNNTDGSNGIDVSYTIPLNPRNGTLRLFYGMTSSSIIDPNFEILDIDSRFRYYELSYRQPVFQSPFEEFVLGITALRQEVRSEFLEEDLPFPALGADENGRTKISALQFFQEWTQRNSNQVLAARSQVNLGLNLLNSTINEGTPDSRFLSWQGQGQWVRLLAPDTLLLVRGDIQLADGSLLPSEKFGLGGQDTVRGYRQYALLTDNGMLLSSELRIPVLRVPSIKGILQVTPFVDMGTTWNSAGEDPNPNSLIGVGMGLLWRMEDTFSARLDWGIPLIRFDSSDRTWQENGVYFSVRYTPF